MSPGRPLPWGRINEFLSEVGSARTLDEYERRVVASIGRLIPHDGAAATFLFHCRVPVVSRITPGWESWKRGFNEYYRHRFPLRFAGEPIVAVNDFRPWNHTEYYTDFMRPAGVGRALSVVRGRFQVAVLRSPGERPFSMTDRQVLEVIRPHLLNLFRLHTAPLRYEAAPVCPVELRRGGRPLTRRESQVVSCLAHRMTSRQAGSALGMSPRTVERHIENMYDKLGVRSRAELLHLLTSGAFVGPAD